MTELLDRCLLELKALDCEVRSCISRNVPFDHDMLASMMLLDGCFVIHILLNQLVNENKMMVAVEERSKRRRGTGKRKKLWSWTLQMRNRSPLIGMLWIWSLILYDLLKVEKPNPFLCCPSPI